MYIYKHTLVITYFRTQICISVNTLQGLSTFLCSFWDMREYNSTAKNTVCLVYVFRTNGRTNYTEYQQSIPKK